MDGGYTNHSLDNDSLWFLSLCPVEMETASRRVSVFLLYLMFFIAGLVLNCIVVWVNWPRRNSRNGVIFAVLNMAFADLMLMTVIPFFMLSSIMDHVWLWGHFMCNFSDLIYITAFYSSSFFLAYMTVERYLAVTRVGSPRPWGPTEKRRRALVCAALWIVSGSIAIMQNTHVQVLDWGEPGCYFYPEHNFMGWYVSLSITSLILQFLGPGAVIVTFNFLTFRALRALPPSPSQNQEQMQRDQWLVHVYSLVFVLCWLPVHIDMMLMMMNDLQPLQLTCTQVEGIYYAYTVVQCLSSIHCLANPILYNFLSRGFRRSLGKAVAHHLPREAMTGGGAAENGGRGEGRTGGLGATKKVRDMSDSNTSQSDVEP